MKTENRGNCVPAHTPARERRLPAVVIAGSDGAFRAMVVEQLLGCGCRVIVASDGAQLLEELASSLDGESPWPDVVVLNLHLRCLSGLNVLSVLWELPERPATLLVTYLDDQAIDSAAARFGACRVFRKPIDLDQLVQAVMASIRIEQASSVGQLSARP